MNMNEHFETIRRNCDKVIAEVKTPFPGMFYRDGSFSYAEFITPTGLAEYYCDTLADFQHLCETVTAEDGLPEDYPDYDDSFDEVGFDPYEGCHTFDC